MKCRFRLWKPLVLSVKLRGQTNLETIHGLNEDEQLAQRDLQSFPGGQLWSRPSKGDLEVSLYGVLSESVCLTRLRSRSRSRSRTSYLLTSSVTQNFRLTTSEQWLTN